MGYVTQQAYGKQVQEAILFLKGKKKELLATLKKQMDAYSLKMEYERARNIRDKIFSVKKITEKQNVVLSNNQKDIDVVGYFSNGNEIQWVVLYVRAGLLTGRRTHRLKLSAESPETVIQTFLEQTYIHALIPDEIWIPTDFVERHSLEKLLSQRSQRDVKILVRRSENSLRLLGMAYENAKLIFEENKIETDPAIELQKTLGLKGPPIHIEGIDVSNLQIEAPVVSLVHFEQGRPDKSRYRLFYPKLVQSQNDFAMIYEGVLRRFKDMDNPAPDLLLIDGGKGQLQAAARALQEHSLNIPICALAKARTQHGFTRKELQKVQERIFLPNRKNPVLLNSGHPALCLLQQIRDEAHRFAIKGHRRRRSKSRLAESTLTQMRGIGQRTRQKLLKYFGGMDQISNASIDELKGAGITQSQAEAVYDLFHITPAGCT